MTSTFLPDIYRQSLVRRAVVSLVRVLVRPWPYRLAPAAGKSCGAHICPIPCSLYHLMPSHVHPYPHGPPENVATLPAPINCTYSRSTCAVRSCRTKITSSSSNTFRQVENAWNLLDFDNQSASFFCVDFSKYCSVPSVPSRLEGGKTRPQG